MFIEIPANKSSIVRRKPVYGVGINDAKYKMRTEIGMCPFYQRWLNMIERCYSDKFQKRRPTYIGCTVCEEWLIFSNFKNWMFKRNWKGTALDKDIISPGNNTYSPENCCFVSVELNNLLCDSGASRGKYPQGVTIDRHGVKFVARVRYNAKYKRLGLFLTPESAGIAYVKAKISIIIEAASKQDDKRVSKGLLLHASLLAGYK